MSTLTFTRSHGPVTSELFVRFATLLNDFNPAHYDLDFATSVGLPGVIGPGTLIQGWLLADLESELGHPTAATDRPHGARGIDLRLKAPYLVGDVVEIEYSVDGEDVGATVRASAPGGEPRPIATATIRWVRTDGAARMTRASRPGVTDLVTALAGALDETAETTLGYSVALAFRWEPGPRGLFVSGLPVDVVDRVATTFGAAIGETAAPATVTVVAERWSADGPDAIGYGPVPAAPDESPTVTLTLTPSSTPALSPLEALQGLRTRLRTTSAALAAELDAEPDVAALATAHGVAPDAAHEVMSALAQTRRLVGRYLLDAGDLYDDERIDQLGDGYLRVSSLWDAVADRPEKELVADAVALERACLGWMAGAAEPPTRYAF